MIYRLHKNFLKNYRRLPEKLKEAVKERISLFCHDPFSQILNNHALAGKYQGYRSINVTGDYRAIYRMLSTEEAIFELLGSHSQLYDK